MLHRIAQRTAVLHSIAQRTAVLHTAQDSTEDCSAARGDGGMEGQQVQGPGSHRGLVMLQSLHCTSLHSTALH